jgi:hypothetical protein
MDIQEPAPYKEAFPRGTYIRVADRAFLERFMNEWKLHHKLQHKQLTYAGQEARVKEVAFYHGGDLIYALEDIPGLWLEPCLRAA